MLWRRVWKTRGRSKCFVSQKHLLSEFLTLRGKLITDKPQVSLRLGASLDPDNLRTGEPWLLWVEEMVNYLLTARERCLLWMRSQSEPDSPQADLAAQCKFLGRFVQCSKCELASLVLPILPCGWVQFYMRSAFLDNDDKELLQTLLVHNKTGPAARKEELMKEM